MQEGFVEAELGREERKELLNIAREAIYSHFRGSPPRDFSLKSGGLEAYRGAFVTLHDRYGRLRGCIGTFIAEKPLYKTVRDMAVQSAFHDPRFFPLKESELGETDIEISVLSPLREIRKTDEIEIGKHGIYIIKGRHCGTLLPQVAVEHGWDANTFLEQTCIKAGLPQDGWKEDAVILTYSAQVFSETRLENA